MNADVSRRVFVGSVAAGIPLLAGAAYGVRRGSAVIHAHDRSAAEGSDLVFDHALKELAAVHNRVQRRGARGEDARAMAAQLRTTAAYGLLIGIDAPSKQAVSDLVRSKGRDAALYSEVDRSTVKARLKQYGVQLDDPVPNRVVLDYNARNDVLNELTNRGVSRLLTHTAATFETIGADMDRLGDRIARVHRVQPTDPNWYIGYCQQLQVEIARLGVDAGLVCGASFFWPALAPVCAMIEIAAAVQGILFLSSCT